MYLETNHHHGYIFFQKNLIFPQAGFSEILKLLRDGLKKKHVIFSDIVTIAFDPHPP